MQLDQRRWTRLWARLGPTARATDPFERLQEHYREPARRYHNAPHIVACLRLFDEVSAFAADPFALELAIWFHDVIYDPRGTDNEERSAQFARDAIAQAGGSPGLAGRVAALVIATKLHQPGTESDSPWMIDIDLAILGQPAGVFDAYERAIHAEYAWVVPAEYCAKRTQVLEGFLARDSIFHTVHFRERFEASARASLQRSIERLRRGDLPQ